MYLGDNLELLALAELRLGNSLLETVDSLGVELLFPNNQYKAPQYKIPKEEST